MKNEEQDVVEAHPKRRPRRFFQFSLRTLLVFVLLVSIGMSWLGVKLDRARRQREAVIAVGRWGGSVAYSDGGGFYTDARFDAPGWRWSTPMWMRDLLGHDAFRYVISVRLNWNCESALPLLESFPRMQLLDLTDTDVTDADLRYVRDLTELRTLYLHGTKVGDDGVVHLRSLEKLRIVSLNGTEVTDAAIEHLCGLAELTYVSLERTQVTPEGVAKLQEALPECEIIYEE
jgi:hypothetical protein